MGDLNGTEVEDYLVASVQIEPMAMQEEYVRIAPDLAYWNDRYAKVLKSFQIAKLEVETTEARLYIQQRNAMLDEGKKPTEAQINTAVTIDPELREVKMELIMAEVEKVRIAGVCDAVRTKRDMLVSLGATMRAEYASEPSIRAQARDVRRVRENG